MALRVHTLDHPVLQVTDPQASVGACGTLVSIYCRDPDGGLIEISSRRERAG